MKRCSNCFQYKPLDQFYRKLTYYQSRCKGCNAEVVYSYHYKHKLDKIEKYFEKKDLAHMQATK